MASSAAAAAAATGHNRRDPGAGLGLRRAATASAWGARSLGCGACGTAASGAGVCGNWIEARQHSMELVVIHRGVADPVTVLVHPRQRRLEQGRRRGALR